jgi:hypothetical protein
MPRTMLAAVAGLALLLGGTALASNASATTLTGVGTLPSAVHDSSPVQTVACWCGRHRCACGRVWHHRRWRCWWWRGRRVCGWRY